MGVSLVGQVGVYLKPMAVTALYDSGRVKMKVLDVGEEPRLVSVRRPAET